MPTRGSRRHVWTCKVVVLMAGTAFHCIDSRPDRGECAWSADDGRRLAGESLRWSGNSCSAGDAKREGWIQRRRLKSQHHEPDSGTPQLFRHSYSAELQNVQS
jgi:hypothetical protein